VVIAILFQLAYQSEAHKESNNRAMDCMAKAIETRIFFSTFSMVPGRMWLLQPQLIPIGSSLARRGSALLHEEFGSTSQSHRTGCRASVISHV